MICLSLHAAASSRSHSKVCGALRRRLHTTSLALSMRVSSPYLISLALIYNCIVQLNLTRTQLEKLKSIEARASSILKSKTCDLKHEIDKHAILLVRKCLNGIVCTNFQDYFMINEHNVRTRNRNILLQIPKVKLEFAKNGLFFMGARLYNLLPKDIRESADDFENKVNSFLK